MTRVFGIEARKRFYTVRYIRLPDFLLEIEVAKRESNYAEALNKYLKLTLLSIDEWLLMKLNNSEVKHVFELIHKHCKRSSTIFCSQFREEGWHERISSDDSTLTDAIMDRITYDF
ncbi:MAG: transposase/IS protein [Firmicutes bacterium ADurb.Bin146]|jgi:DNA replication protein DnaC|nr:MAG: transposase/IS protein [Firmicutes bacterium ADurb.Bin146]